MNICVFCGSSRGVAADYADTAVAMADAMASAGCNLVYGGGNVGLMGVLADQMMKNGRKVTGIIPEFLMQREVGHLGITALEVVPSMHARKKRMADLTDVFIALPGGIGTLEELGEIMTWRQLGLITAPIGILNVKGFFDPLILQFTTMVTEGFLKPANLEDLKISSKPAELLTMLGVVTV